MLLTAFLITVANLQELAAIDRNDTDVGRRLAAGSAELCSGYVSNPGWTLADVEQYEPGKRSQADYRRMATAAFSLQSTPTVVFVHAGSAAARAGLVPGDALLSINAHAIADTVTARASRSRLVQIERNVPVRSVRVRRNGRPIDLTLTPERGCPSHFLISREGGLRGVSSDGRNVGVSAEMLEYVRTNDDELALVLAHELAHNILGHNKGSPATRAAGEDRSGRSKKSREAEADRWALYLMARAGYDVGAAPGFWRRWGPKTSFGIFSSGSHPGWRERAAAAEAEVAGIRAKQASGQLPIP